MYADTNTPLIRNSHAENGAKTCLPCPLPDTDSITSLSCSPGSPVGTNGLLPVTNDVVFKAIFGQEDSKPILRSFLNAFLKLDIKNPEQIELLNTEINPELIADKKCVLDIKVRLPDKTSIDIEIQVVNQYNMDKRSIYYVSKLCAQQLDSGDEYAILRPSIGLNLLCFNLFEDDRYHLCIVLKDKDTNDFFSDLIRIEFFEIHKALRTISTKEEETKKLEVNSIHLTETEQWTLFIGSPNEEVLKMLTTQNEAIRNAYERLQHVSSDEKMRAQAISREKALRDWNSSINGSYRAGFEQGENVGFERGESVGFENGVKQTQNTAAANMTAYMRSEGKSEEEILQLLINAFSLTRENARIYLTANCEIPMSEETD